MRRAIRAAACGSSLSRRIKHLWLAINAVPDIRPDAAARRRRSSFSLASPRDHRAKLTSAIATTLALHTMRSLLLMAAIAAGYRGVRSGLVALT
jgi:hypothetical protein